MSRTIRGGAVALAGTLLLWAAGCVPLRSQGLRKAERRIEADRAEVYDSYLNEARDGRAPGDELEPTSMFGNTRRPGGLSAEARQIEREMFNNPGGGVP